MKKRKQLACPPELIDRDRKHLPHYFSVKVDAHMDTMGPYRDQWCIRHEIFADGEIYKLDHHSPLSITDGMLELTLRHAHQDLLRVIRKANGVVRVGVSDEAGN